MRLVTLSLWVKDEVKLSLGRLGYIYIVVLSSPIVRLVIFCVPFIVTGLAGLVIMTQY